MDGGRGYGTFFKWKVGTKEGLGLEIGWGCYAFTNYRLKTVCNPLLILLMVNVNFEFTLE